MAMETLLPDLTVDQTRLQITLLHQMLPECISDQIAQEIEKDLKSNTPVKMKAQVELTLMTPSFLVI